MTDYIRPLYLHRLHIVSSKPVEAVAHKLLTLITYRSLEASRSAVTNKLTNPVVTFTMSARVVITAFGHRGTSSHYTITVRHPYLPAYSGRCCDVKYKNCKEIVFIIE